MSLKFSHLKLNNPEEVDLVVPLTVMTGALINLGLDRFLGHDETLVLSFCTFNP